MITDGYSKMISDIGMRSMLQSNDYGEELGLLLREQRKQEVSDRERELNPYRSGSAPPTVEGSLSAVGGLYGHIGGGAATDIGGISEEELRSDPSYVSYYYSNVNLNPRLPQPLLSKEDWRFAQRLQCSSGSSESGGIGDKRKVNRGGDDGGSKSSLFSMQLGFNGKKEENVIELRKPQGVAEWGGDGLIGLPGLGLGSRQKSITEIIQDDINHATSLSRHPSRPASRNAFDDSIDSSESNFSHLHRELASMDALHSGANIQGMLSVQNIGSSASHTYASALGASLSRSTTPDPQLAVRAPSPRLPPVGGGRTGSMDKRTVNGPNSFNGASPGMGEPADLLAALSGMTLSTDDMVDEENHSCSRVQQEIDDRQNLFHLQGNQKQQPYLNKSESVHFHLHPASQLAKGLYPNMGKSNGAGMDLNNSSLIANGQVALNKPAVSCANSCLKGPSTPILNSKGSSPPNYQNLDSPNSSFSNFGLSGYAINPASPSMMGNHNGNMLPLFENVAAASAMGVSGMDSRALGGGLALGPNLMAATAELRSLSRVGNHNAGSALQVPLMDPLYLQYLRSNEYAAAQVAALNDPSMDGECISNSYMDLIGLQKAYLGSLLSPQKSQFGLPYLGKSGSMNHGFYGNPAFGLGMSYPGSPLTGPLLPNSPIGSGSPVSLGERNMRFHPGMRNLAGGVMGSWPSEAGGNLDESFPSSLLDEFKSNKTRCFELSEIADHVVEFSADQYGSRFIQQKLETATAEEKNMVFREIMPHALTLMTDVFGNYVIQKFFEHGTGPQIRELADQLTGHVLNLSLQMYGCRVIQKAIEVVDLEQQTKMVTELDGHVMRCVRDQNGNHVIQKCIECIPQDSIQFIVSVFYDQVVTLSTHPYGCRVIQRVLEHCSDPKTQHIVMDEILLSVNMLAQDQYGNYVVQHVLEHGKPHERSAIINKLIGQIVQMSQQKFASNVVEKCLTFGTPAERQILVNEMLGSTDENEPLQVMMKDQFANYVVQKVLETCDDQQLELILNRIKVHLNALKKYTYGKHIVARVEKLVAAGGNREEGASNRSAGRKKKGRVRKPSQSTTPTAVLANSIIAINSKKANNQVYMAIGRFLYDVGLPLDAVNSVYFQQMIDAISSQGAGFAAPSYHDLRSWILKILVQEVRNDVDQCMGTWGKTGCSVLVDECISEKSKTLINFSIYCPEGTMFLKSLDISNNMNSTNALYELLREVVEEVGVRNVLQVVTTSEEKYVVAGKRLTETFPSVFWTPSAAACIDLMLSDFRELEWIKGILEKAKSISRFIYNHGFVLNMMRRYTFGIDLVDLGVSRFATDFITLSRMVNIKHNLQSMVTSEEWMECPYSKKPGGLAMLDNIGSQPFWTSCTSIVRLTGPLLRLLRMVGSEKRPAMGYVYAGIYRAKETIKKELVNKKDYLVYWNIIDHRWAQLQHHPLHAAGFYLNPKFFYGIEGDMHLHIRSMVYDCIEKLVPDPKIQDKIVKETTSYHNAAGDFGRKMAIRARDTLLPAEWWLTYGGGCPNLARLAIRILSQTCSLIGWKPNQIPIEQTHEKKNFLEHQRLKDLLFVQYNLRLKQMVRKNKEQDAVDPISYDNIDIVEDWVTEKELCSEDFGSSDWMTVDLPLGNPMMLGPSIDDAEDLGSGFDDYEIFDGVKDSEGENGEDNAVSQ